jgi:hypothetical protein
MMLGLFGEFGASGPTWLVGGGAELSNTPINQTLTDPLHIAGYSQHLDDVKQDDCG